MFFKRRVIDGIDGNNKIVCKLKSLNWFHNHWLAGLFLFALNAGLFFTVVLILYVLMFVDIPYVHILVMLAGTILSIYFWAVINKTWQGSAINCFKMALLGSSFYAILGGIFIYLLVTLGPDKPGEDLFMKALGLFIGLCVTATAFLICLYMIGIPNGRKQLYKVPYFKIKGWDK